MKYVRSLTNRQIASYWKKRQDESGLSVDWAESHERCWRCGYKSKRLQHCHIIPESLGGLYAESNLVLLCGRCHRETPNVADSRFMWIWLRANAFPFYDSSLYFRAIIEFEHMFGRKPFVGMTDQDIQQADVFIKDAIRSTIIHWGEGRRNPATLACIFATVEEKVLGVLPVPRNSSWLEEAALLWAFSQTDGDGKNLEKLCDKRI